MEKVTKIIKSVKKPYNDKWARLLIALLAAHYILSHTTPYGFFEVITVSGYFPSLCGSFIIAFLIVYAVYKITITLDQYMPYAINWKKRLCYQPLFGVFAVTLWAFGLACLYFWLNGVPERAARYLNQDLPIVLAFIIMVNAYYFIFYALKVTHTLRKELFLLIRRIRKQELHQFGKKQGTTAEENTDAHEVAFVVKVKRRLYLVGYINGETSAGQTTITDSIKELPSERYFMINRKCIINISIIEAVREISSKRYLVVLKSPFNNHLSEEDLTVSQGNKQQFNRWLGDRNLR